jgi:MoaA/NifB/PqqE/SkfB family radical SAM enzyme
MSLRCRHAFEYACVHANGEVVCSIIDGRGDFVLGNVHQQSLGDIFHGSRAARLRELVLASPDQHCAAVGKRCPLKNLARVPGESLEPTLKYLAIEPTTACDLRCLVCPVRDFSGDVTWRDAYHDGGAAFLAWDGARRAKQHGADLLRHALPRSLVDRVAKSGRIGELVLRGRIPPARRGTLPLDVVRRVVSEAGPHLDRIDFFNYGEPFLYRHLVDALRHIRVTWPQTRIAISTDGMQVRPPVEDAIVNERLVDWLIFSIDGCDDESYRRYRIRGRFETAFANLLRVHQKAAGTAMRVIWQYVVFRWNDRDDQFRRAIALSEQHGLPLHFDFAHTWGRSRRKQRELEYLVPYLKPFTALPGMMRSGGW